MSHSTDALTPADAVTPADVRAAVARLAGVVRRTPVLSLDLPDGREVVCKLEHLQITGSFKARGASNAVALLDPDVTGVAAASGGNHGQAVAWAATRHGLPSLVVVPETSPDAKADRVAGFGAEVVRHGAIYDEAETLARRLADERGYAFVHAFADPRVIAGQGTVTVEMIEQAPDCDAVVIAIGGGGLISGAAVAAGGSGVSVIGAEPRGAPTLHDAVAAGEPVTVAVDTITASALGARRTSGLNLALVTAGVAQIVQVDDADMVAAREWLWDSARIPAEVSAAAGLAAVMSGQIAARRPCVLICGANEPWAPTG